jgi:hypothetical protein
MLINIYCIKSQLSVVLNLSPYCLPTRLVICLHPTPLHNIPTPNPPQLQGSGVTDTIKSGIADVSYYTYQPELLMYGMLCALLAAGIWLALATFLELPVSTTHTIVGAIIGMSMVAMGPDSVVWTCKLF